MHLKIKPILVLSILLLVSLTGVAAADEQKIKILYVAYSPNNAMETASRTCVYGDFIEYAYIPGYNTTTWGASNELLAAAQSGLLLDQDIIFCDMLSSKVYTETNDSFYQAHENGISLVSIRSSGTPSYFDYVSDGKQNDEICNYYNNMGTSGKGLENAENLLIYLAKEYGNSPALTDGWGSSTNNYDEFLFILGTDFNKDTLKAAALAADIDLQFNITVLSTEEVPDNFDFTEYAVIFIESQDEALVNDVWRTSINTAKGAGAKVIGYNLSRNITMANVDLYSEEYTNIERFWIQGGQTNMKTCSGSWARNLQACGLTRPIHPR